MNESRPSRNRLTPALLAVLCVLVVVFGTLIVLRLGQSADAQGENVTGSGPTVVYMTDGEGSQGVPYYHSVFQDEHVGLLPNFTPVDMICWEDAEGQRWFRVLLDPETRDALNRSTVVVQAEHTKNQTIVDSC